MPVYTNSSGSSAHWPGVGNVAAGRTVTWNDYIYPIPTGFTLTNHNNTAGAKQAPWVTLHNAVIGAGVTKTGLEQYDRIVIYNGSGAALNVAANDDTDALVMANGATYELTQAIDRKILSKIVITGAGGSAINVTAWND